MDSSGPQVYTPPPEQQKEVYQGHHNGLEVTKYPGAQYGQYYYPPTQQPERLILGMRRTTFFLSAALLFVIIAAAVGGGVGGGLAVKEAETRCRKDLGEFISSATVTVTATVITTGSIVTTIPPSTPTRSSRPTNTAGRLSVPTTGLLELDCPTINDSTQSVTLFPTTSRFNTTCGIDLNGSGVDIMAVVSYNYADCLRACASFNRNAGESVCKGVQFNADMTTVVPNYFGTCWLKRFTNVQSIDRNASNADLHVAGILL